MGKQNVVLTVNTGSSSIKCAVYAFDDLELLYECTFEAIGTKHARFVTPATSTSHSSAHHDYALIIVIEDITRFCQSKQIKVVSYRVVHGGAKFREHTLINQEVLDAIQQYAYLNPSHAPATLASIRHVMHALPRSKHIACFDTAFFRDMPKLATLTSLPHKYYDRGLRRYGFHGLSYTYLQSKLRQIDKDTVQQKVIYAHLGSGSSMCAVDSGNVQDTTMGLSPISGLMSSSRSGDIDPGVIGFLRYQHIDGDSISSVLSEQSGLLGVSGESKDMKTLLDISPASPNAQEAIDLYCYQASKHIASLAATMNGLDVLVFSGGIGEKSPIIRANICKRIGFLGVQLDPKSNNQNQSLISITEARVKTYILETDEQIILAREAKKLV